MASRTGRSLAPASAGRGGTPNNSFKAAPGSSGKDSRVTEVLDEFKGLANARMTWETYWRQIAAYVLPQTAQFEHMLSMGASQSVNAVVDEPVAAQRSKDVYDMTSLWGVERLSAGMLTLKTPESSAWQDLVVDVDFGYEPNHTERAALERVRNYLFKIRSNPHSGFWPAHKAAVKSMCAFGDGWMLVEENMGGRTPFLYQYIPLIEGFPSVDRNGQPNRMFRLFQWSPLQIMEKWPDTPGRIRDLANDPQQRHNRVRVMHAVKPRTDKDRSGKMGVYGSGWTSYYCLPDDEMLLGEGGYFEFPFSRYAWANNGNSPYCEGPVAIALGEIKSLQEMAKNELIAVQSLIRPAIATAGKNMQRRNFNPGATNPGLINGNGDLLFAPLNGGVRPDFAKLIMTDRRGALREMLYLNLWQILMGDPNQTATEALIRAQEKGELLGPVGISMNEGLSSMTDREIGIIGRKGAFKEGSPLALPESLYGREVAPRFTSPLDRLRRYGELVGIQRLLEIIIPLMEAYPKARARIDIDEMIDTSAEILGVPVKVLTDRRKAQEQVDAEAATMEGAQNAEAIRMGGEAAAAAGAGAASLAQGAEAVAASPVMQRTLQQLQGTVPQ